MDSEFVTKLKEFQKYALIADPDGGEYICGVNEYDLPDRIVLKKNKASKDKWVKPSGEEHITVGQMQHIKRYFSQAQVFADHFDTFLG